MAKPSRCEARDHSLRIPCGAEIQAQAVNQQRDAQNCVCYVAVTEDCTRYSIVGYWLPFVHMNKMQNLFKKFPCFQ